MTKKGEFVFTQKRSDEMILLPDTKYPEMNKIYDFISNQYDSYIAAFTTEGFKVAYVLLKDDKQDSRRDEWEIIFFDKSSGKSAGTITLDNIDEIDNDNGEEKYEIIKKIKANYEEVINMSVNLIKKYREIDDT